jgi:hypothetical protein
MALFNAVAIDARKLLEYCLSDSHPRGRNKARVFRSRLGLAASHAEVLRIALLQAVQSQPDDLQLRVGDHYGRHYMLDFEMTTTAGKAMVRSIWIIRHNEEVLRFVTCFVR